MQIIEQFEQYANTLWKGKEIELQEVTDFINDFVDNIVQSTGLMEKNGIVFPMEYVVDSLREYQSAIELKDDYIMADCLYFQWKEIAQVYLEVMAEIGE